ncbi:uncharacterized protein LOC103317557 [Nasonia vitripennis]|uniref:Uncharacterized protein n=1 Tax=Nasonia vitripennis TaxID=7425 RepID=A0A7M7HG70_NASVI|nr:uncharacterized protein LOC103317557 [Nasonia vitripennis]
MFNRKGKEYKIWMDPDSKKYIPRSTKHDHKKRKLQILTDMLVDNASNSDSDSDNQSCHENVFQDREIEQFEEEQMDEVHSNSSESVNNVEIDDIDKEEECDIDKEEKWINAFLGGQEKSHSEEEIQFHNKIKST